MTQYALGFAQIDKTMTSLVGGKGANLGELSRIDGVRVPEGFCVTTQAYSATATQTPELADLLEQLARLGPGTEREKLTAEVPALCARIRQSVQAAEPPAAVVEAVRTAWAKQGADRAYAVRSSATAEDLAGASFAGQQDTYLNLVGIEAILDGVRRCWASLFTDRAVIYRIENGYDHRTALPAVVVQRMVVPSVSGVMFTADPISSDRRVVSIDASYGLGEALVSGLVTADNYRVQAGRIAARTISTKTVEIVPAGAEGVMQHDVDVDRRNSPALTDAQALRLAGTARQIKAHFGAPQDIEWCLDDDGIAIVQSRPITTLYPVPAVTDHSPHVYMSMGHQQMMTDAMKPLGLSFFQLGFPDIALLAVGGRLYIDASADLRSFVGRKILLATTKMGDPLIHDALATLAGREGLLRSLPRGRRVMRLGAAYFSPAFFLQIVKLSRAADDSVVAGLIAADAGSVDAMAHRLADASGLELLDLLATEQERVQKVVYDPRSMAAVFTGVLAGRWLDAHVAKWLGEKGVSEVLSASAPHNVTAEMGVDLLEVADVARQHPEVIAYLRDPHPDVDTFFADLERLAGGPQTAAALQQYLDRYGSRCPGEIDITRTRLSENPSALAPLILADIAAHEPGGRSLLLERGQRRAHEKERDILARLRRLPGGRRKAKQTAQKIAQLRAFVGYREYPKYMMIRRYGVIKQALWREARRLVAQGVLADVGDVAFLSLDELREAVRTGRADTDAIARRRADQAVFEQLTPPRVMTSDGEVITGGYGAGNAPAGALRGLPASSGSVEGRARVVLALEDADLEDGDILVTTFTDPSWTPAFVTVAGLVTEVGGMMTHGSVVAREYGLPAVVGVPNATTLIETGQRIRVDGTDGYVEILPS